jgi:hypothetical protein
MDPWKHFSGVSYIDSSLVVNFSLWKIYILRFDIMLSMVNSRIVVSREQDAKLKGRLGLKVIAYTSEL